jgi:hypothetical protein
VNEGAIQTSGTRLTDFQIPNLELFAAVTLLRRQLLIQFLLKEATLFSRDCFDSAELLTYRSRKLS